MPEWRGVVKLRDKRSGGLTSTCAIIVPVRRAEHSGRALLWVISWLVVAALVFWLLTIALAPANAGALRAQVGTVRSSVSEALLVTAGGDAGRLSRPFMRTEIELLGRDVDSAARSLATVRPEAELRDRFAEAAGLASAAATGLRTLAAGSAPPESLIAAQATLAELVLRIQEIERELEP